MQHPPLGDDQVAEARFAPVHNIRLISAFDGDCRHPKDGTILNLRFSGSSYRTVVTSTYVGAELGKGNGLGTHTLCILANGRIVAQGRFTLTH